MFINTTGIGANAQVCGSNQVQLGDFNTLAYCYGSGIISRSDARDKADIRDTRLGLDFICALHPVDYKWDMREDYQPLLLPPSPSVTGSVTALFPFHSNSAAMCTMARKRGLGTTTVLLHKR